MTRYQLHVQQWENCTRCHLHQTRQRVVIGRTSPPAQIPAQVLFIGEAPGHSEDSIGEAFVGEAGSLLQEDIINEVMPSSISYAFTNLIACIPLQEDGLTKEEDGPPDDCVKACAPRLIEFVKMCQPKLIVTVGKHAKHWLDSKYRHSIKIGYIEQCDIMHPAAIVRANYASKPILIKRQVVTLRDTIYNVFGITKGE